MPFTHHGWTNRIKLCVGFIQKRRVEKYNVELIGAKEDAIDKAEDRGRFKEAMEKIGLSTPKSFVCHTLEEAWAAQSEVGFRL